MSDALAEAEEEMKNELVRLPNLPHALVAPGKSAEDNVIVRSGGETPVLHKDAVPHWELIKKYDIIEIS